MTLRTAPWGPVSDDGDHRRRDAGPRLLPFHRLGHADPEHRWWKPLVELVVFGAVYLLVTVVFGVVWAVGVMSTRGQDALDDLFADPLALDVMDPAVFFMMFFSIVLMIPAILLARLVMGPRPVGLLLSVTGRLRWAFLARTLAVALTIYVIGYGAVSLFELLVLGELSAPQPVEGFGLILAMVVLVVPLQCAAEELVFRGYLLQTVGRWVRRPVFAVLLPVPLFTFAHFYDVWGLLSVAVMAVVAGWLSWRTGGLEAAIGLHVANNVVVTLLAAVGWADPNATESSWVAAALTVVFDVVYAVLVVRLARKHGVEVTRTVPAPLPPLTGGWGPVPAAPVPPGAWMCPGPPACPGHWVGHGHPSAPQPAPERLP